jgi:hypothetical protein
MPLVRNVGIGRRLSPENGQCLRFLTGYEPYWRLIEKSGLWIASDVSDLFQQLLFAGPVPAFRTIRICHGVNGIAFAVPARLAPEHITAFFAVVKHVDDMT